MFCDTLSRQFRRYSKETQGFSLHSDFAVFEVICLYWQHFKCSAQHWQDSLVMKSEHHKEICHGGSN